MVEPIDFSKTQRIVLVIDLHPLLAFQNGYPNPYLATILAAAKRLLPFAPLSNSLFAFKFFFSSLSPLRSASEVHRLLPDPILTTLSFNDNRQTLTSLAKILNILATLEISSKLSNEGPRASYAASSLLQLVHDYAWESESDNFTGKGNDDFQMIPSNMILLFSPLCRSIHAFSVYLEMDANIQVLNDLDRILLKFRNVFAGVNYAFRSKDIHFSWIDVKCELNGDEVEVKTNEYETQFLPVLDGIRKLGWGFCSADAIVLGSAIVPFGLIYPMISVSYNFLNLDAFWKRSSVQLNLGILDVNGKPLECNCSDLELLNLKVLSGHGSDDILRTLVLSDSQAEVSDQCKNLGHEFLGGVTKLCIKAVQKYNEGKKVEIHSTDIILVREFFGEFKKPKKKSNDFFAEKVLHILSGKSKELVNSNSMPIWQILLSFLYKEGYWALVSLSNSSKQETLGMLKPLTANCALLSITNNDFPGVHGYSLSDFNKVHDIHETCVDTSDFNGINSSQSETSTSGNYETSRIGKKKKKQKHLSQDLTWSSFCKAAFECSEFDLADVYFARYFDQKKLKFLKCWMKQIIRYSNDCLSMMHMSDCSGKESASLNFSSGPSGIQEGDVFATFFETSETFLNSLPKRIQQGLESGMDLATLAERLVKSSIQSCQACINSENMELQNPMAKADDSGKVLLDKLAKLLLKDPKEMKDLHKFDDPMSDKIVREYELQVLLRMEILRSNILVNMEEPVKQKLLKQICSFLEIIQYLIDGGIHGNVSLYEYVERTIKMRYYDILEDVVNNIYVQMDLLPFGDEEERQAILFNSEDSSQSWRDMKEMPERIDMYDIPRSVSVEDEQHQPLENVSPKGIMEDEHARKLSEARERRERARRFVSFTSWKPDLQRVWAPKQPKAIQGRPDSVHKDSKREKRRSASYTVVHETPMTDRKRPYSRENSEGDDEGNCSRVSKALFQDN